MDGNTGGPGRVAGPAFEVHGVRWSLRNQILVPLVGIQALAIVAITVATARLAAQRTERQIIGQLNGVIATLGRSSFPYTAGVLSQMHGLSGAHFVAYDDDGQAVASSLPQLDRTPGLRLIRPADRLDTLGASPTLELGGSRYFAVALPGSAGLGRSALLVLYPEAAWRQARWESALPTLALGLGALGLMAVVTSWIAHRINRRVARMRAQVARIAEGDFRAIDVGRQVDEVQSLAVSINRMCEQLVQMREAIGQSERTRLLAQLAAGLAHQLRNSLTGARMSVQLHRRRCASAAGDSSLEVALRQLALTEEHVRGLLSLGRVELRTPVPCDLKALLAEIALLIEPACQHARVELRRAGLENGAASCLADEAGLRAAVLNLAVNAIEAAGPGGTVSLGITPNHETVTIQVSDNGSGPPADVAASLFDPFVTSKPEGVGLGLALAQRVAVEHGGRLSWNRERGETHFRLELPRSLEPPRESV